METDPDVSHPDFPGIQREGGYFINPQIDDESHPHLQVSASMISVPHVKPGDMVFWHCVRFLFGYALYRPTNRIGFRI